MKVAYVQDDLLLGPSLTHRHPQGLPRTSAQPRVNVSTGKGQMLTYLHINIADLYSTALFPCL